MVNIDLKTTSEKTAVESSTDLSLIVVFILTAITLAAYGGVYFYEKSMANSILTKQEEINIASQKINGPDSKKVIDFQNRLKIAKDYTNKKNDLLETFSEMEKLVVAGVYVNSIDYNKEKGTMNVALMADDYANVAKQISSFNSSQFFKNVSVGKSEVDSSGKIEMEVILSIN